MTGALGLGSSGETRWVASLHAASFFLTTVVDGMCLYMCVSHRPSDRLTKRVDVCSMVVSGSSLPFASSLGWRRMVPCWLEIFLDS